MQAFAAIGAALRLSQSEEQTDPEIRVRLLAVVEAELPGALDGLDAQQVSNSLKYVTQIIGEAADLFQNPYRPPGWVLGDPATLQAWGQASRQNIRGKIALAADRPRLAAAFTGRFLDVGTGVGAMALEAAERYPSLQVVGLDIWGPSLVLARANVAASQHAARIEIRAQDVTQLDERDAYTLAWLATPFMPRAIAEAALDRLGVALAPNGYLVAGLFATPPDKAGAAFTALRVIRSGGHLWDVADMEQQLIARGFVDVETCAIPPTCFVIGRRP